MNETITNQLSSLFWIFLTIGIIAIVGIFLLFIFSIMATSSRESRAEEKRNGVEFQIKEKEMKELQRLVLPDGTVFTVKKGLLLYYLFVDDVKYGPFLTVNRAKRFAIMKFNLYWSI